MKIEAVTKYNYKGKEYKTLEEIKEAVHNTIGLEVIDKINRVCPPQKHKDLFKLLEVLCLPEVRETLTECYSITFERETQDFDYNTEETETINILDLK